MCRYGPRTCSCRYSFCRRCRAYGKCEASSLCILVLEPIPLDFFSLAFVPLQSDPHMIKEIVEAVSIPIMAKVRIGHFVEAQVSDMTTRTHTSPPFG